MSRRLFTELGWRDRGDGVWFDGGDIPYVYVKSGQITDAGLFAIVDAILAVDCGEPAGDLLVEHLKANGLGGLRDGLVMTGETVLVTTPCVEEGYDPGNLDEDYDEEPEK